MCAVVQRCPWLRVCLPVPLADHLAELVDAQRWPFRQRNMQRLWVAATLRALLQFGHGSYSKHIEPVASTAPTAALFVSRLFGFVRQCSLFFTESSRPERYTGGLTMCLQRSLPVDHEGFGCRWTAWI